MIAYTEIASNKRKTALLITSFLVVVIALGWVFDLAYADPAILVFAVVLAVGSALFSYYFSDRITLAVSDAKPVTLQSNPQLYNVVENLCIAAGLPMPRIFIINDQAMNAFATGRDPKHAVVCVTAGLLQNMDKTEARRCDCARAVARWQLRHSPFDDHRRARWPHHAAVRLDAAPHHFWWRRQASRQR